VVVAAAVASSSSMIPFMASAFFDNAEGTLFWVGSTYDADFADCDVRMIMTSRECLQLNMGSEVWLVSVLGSQKGNLPHIHRVLIFFRSEGRKIPAGIGWSQTQVCH